MKKSICIAFLAAFLCQLEETSAQRWRSDRDETLFSRSQRGGFFAAPIVEYSDLKNDWTTAVGGGVAFIAGDLFFGIYGLGTTDYDRLLSDDFERLDMGHGGFWVGYVYPQQKALHAIASVKAGWGAVDIDFDSEPEYEDAFFAVTPEIGLEVNVFSWFRIGATVGNRFMNGLDDSPNFDKNDLEGMTAALTFRIGGFGRRREKWDD